MERFELSEVQAQAILDMRLGRLQGLEVEKIVEELQRIHARIKELEEILASDELKYDIIKKELRELSARYGDERRTAIAPVENEIDIEDLIEEEECVYTLTRLGYIKRQPTSIYRSQRRGGRGVTAMTTREEDLVDTLFTASTHDNILFFTNYGRVYRLKGYLIPEAGRTAKGMNIVNLLQIDGDEKVTAMIPIREFEEGKYVFFATKMGTVKRMTLESLKTVRKAGIRALSVNDGDELIGVRLTDGAARLIMATREGRALRFDENEVRPMGRDAAGVRGIRLREGDYVVGLARERENAELLTVTENGYGKRTATTEFTEHHRGGSGVTAHNLTEKTGKLAAIKVVTAEDDVMMITSGGVIIRMNAGTIRECGRASQGVILMRLSEDVKVISVARTAKEEEDEYEAGAAEPEETADGE